MADWRYGVIALALLMASVVSVIWSISRVPTGAGELIIYELWE